ncbi:hypothetical protein ASE01_01350 [Nocardioides sp. Root190]|uniref:SGNH/GDSL hydrolase family protein n=1 Tax=Nocardioides sp. Root190 TaxID=1736488 RepID=UPI0006F4545D|nr:SGNH/GDSL hydrolase family protein [Nocardioides sp. Root190]KRB80172.1 hypothetical protein ASE01_01350 [Nocardioides sp. Root190]
MRVITRILVVALGCLALVGLPAAPSVAAPILTVRSITLFPQVGGELTLVASLDGTGGTGSTGDTGDLPGPLTVEKWVAGSGWTQVEAFASSSDAGALTVPLTSGPMAAGGTTWVRVVGPGEGALVSDKLGLLVFGNATPPFTTTPLPTVTGTHAVGSTLRATAGTWTPTPAAIGLQWNRDGVKIGPIAATYTLSAADLGHRITVSAVAFPHKGTADIFTIRDSRPAGPVVRGTFTISEPRILGRAVLGEELRVDLGTVHPSPRTLTHQWSRDGVPVEGATAATHTVAQADAGSVLTVTVRAEADGIEPAERTSAAFTVPADVGPPGPLLADHLRPDDGTPLPAAEVSVRSGTALPAWPTIHRTWWTSPLLTHSQVPVPFLTLASTMYGQDWAREVNGAEYAGTNVSMKNIDVSFTITARRFAIAYRGTRTHDAMVWLDGRPVSATPLVTSSPGDTAYAANWIVIELPERRTTEVRFTGPLSFTGVDVPGDENAVITASPERLTVGVVSDSLFDVCAEARCMSRAAVPTLSSLTGWRVWNLAEGGTGYLSSSSAPGFGAYQPSPFGSPRRLDAMARAPIDLLLVNGSFNDATVASYSAESHRAAVEKYLTDVARLRPGLPVVLVGVEPIGRYQTRYWDDRARAMNATLASMVGRHDNVIGFIDPYTDRWLTGTGSIVAPTGDGNQDVYVGTDGVHLTVAGVAYYVGRIVDELVELRLPASLTSARATP